MSRVWCARSPGVFQRAHLQRVYPANSELKRVDAMYELVSNSVVKQGCPRIHFANKKVRHARASVNYRSTGKKPQKIFQFLQTETAEATCEPWQCYGNTRTQHASGYNCSNYRSIVRTLQPGLTGCAANCPAVDASKQRHAIYFFTIIHPG